jgi:hypothetical protein
MGRGEQSVHIYEPRSHTELIFLDTFSSQTSCSSRHPPLQVPTALNHSSSPRNPFSSYWNLAISTRTHQALAFRTAKGSFEPSARARG